MPTIELNMIVKNGAAGLARCLTSVAPFIDRIVIGDTGSTDATPDIARQFGAELLRLPWEDDFARARNRVLAYRRCDWILVLDADEMLDHHAARQIRTLLDDPRHLRVRQLALELHARQSHPPRKPVAPR